MTRIELPWPPKELSPNARVHRMRKAAVVKAYRAVCGWEAIAQKAPKLPGPLHARITFNPPDRAHRDVDNMLSSIKAAIDAVAAAVGVDDRNWTITIIRGEPAPKAGSVVMELEAA